MRVVLLFLFMISFSQASVMKHTVLVEPEFGTSLFRNIDSPITESLIFPLDSEIKNGFSRGIKIGYANDNIQLALEFMTQDGFSKDSIYKYTVNDLGLFFAWKLNRRFRIFADALVLSSFTSNHPNNIPFHYKMGLGFGVGASYYAAKYLALNVSYRSVNYSTLEGYASSASIGQEASMNSVLASVSFPFEFDFSFWYL